MDIYQNVLNRDLYQICEVDEAERVTMDSDIEYRYFFQLGTMRPDILPIEVSFDYFEDCINSDACNIPDQLLHIKIYDEAIVTTREEAMLRYQMLKYLNKQKNAYFSFYLSDSTMPAYIAFMESLNWKWNNKSRLVLNLDRNYTSGDIPIEKARCKLDISPEKLICFSDQKLHLIRGKVSGVVLDDALELKKFIKQYLNELHDKYNVDQLTDFDKAYIAYHYLFDKKIQNNVALTPLSIEYADDRVRYSKKGSTKLRPSESRWESRALGTLEHKKGVCSGQAKLFRSLICNPEMGVTAENILGTVSNGGIHCWCEFVADGKSYSCCTTGGGIFNNLYARGYEPYDYQYFPFIYQHGSLNTIEQNKVARHVRSLKR